MKGLQISWSIQGAPSCWRVNQQLPHFVGHSVFLCLFVCLHVCHSSSLALHVSFCGAHFVFRAPCVCGSHSSHLTLFLTFAVSLNSPFSTCFTPCPSLFIICSSFPTRLTCFFLCLTLCLSFSPVHRWHHPPLHSKAFLTDRKSLSSTVQHPILHCTSWPPVPVATVKVNRANYLSDSTVHLYCLMADICSISAILPADK